MHRPISTLFPYTTLFRSELDDRHVETHRALLNTYRTTWRGTGWHTADDDGYLYDHLAYHLRAIGAIDELKGLFARSEEHTSELQSRRDLVCRLLLEKKK